MIFSSIEGATTNDVTAERMARALDYLATTDLAALAPGRHEIAGDEVYVDVQEFDTSSAFEKEYEAHRRYADIHVCIEGVELISVTELSNTDLMGDFDEADDCGTYHLKAGHREQWVTLTPGKLLVVFPEDAHRPGCRPLGEPVGHLKKAVVKVLVD